MTLYNKKKEDYTTILNLKLDKNKNLNKKGYFLLFLIFLKFIKNLLFKFIKFQLFSRIL